MKKDNYTQYADKGSCVGLISSALPEVKNKILAASSDTGCPPIVYLRKQNLSQKILTNNRTGMHSELPTEERRKPTTTS